MVDIQSKEVIDKVSKELKIQPAMKIPRELMDKIQLVYNVNPELKGINASASKSTTGAGTIFAVPDDNRDYFLVGATMSVSFNATSDGISVFIRASLADTGQTAQSVLSLVFNPGTVAANQFSISKVFPAPIRLEPGTNVQQVPSFGLGALTVESSLVLYSLDRQ